MAYLPCLPTRNSSYPSYFTARPGNLLQDLPFYQQPSAADAHVEADFEADADAGFDHGTGNLPMVAAAASSMVMLNTSFRPCCTSFDSFFVLVVRIDSDDFRYFRAQMGAILASPTLFHATSWCPAFRKGALREFSRLQAPPLLVMLMQKTVLKPSI